MNTQYRSRARFPGGWLLTLGLALSGCATPPPKAARTTVILMPDEDGRVGAVSVASASGTGGSQWLDSAYTAATVVAGAPSSNTPLPLGRAAFDAEHGALLRAQPLKPVSFTLYFLLDKTVLTDESRAMIPALLDAVRERKPTEITIFGHADASGTDERNSKISAERAKAVADLLRRNEPGLEQMDVHSFGDKVPLVDNGTRGPEPRNRRVEVMIL